MRVAFTSDLHGDVTSRNRELLPFLAEEVARLRPDVFVIAGDAANDLRALGTVLSHFDGVAAQKLFVPGNHDLWLESKKALRRREDSWHKYRVAVPEVCSAHGFHALCGSPMEIDGVGFVGSVGWYDFSLADPRLAEVYRAEDYEHGEFATELGPTWWNDLSRAAWLRNPDAEDWRQRRATLTSREVFARVLALLEEDLAAVRSDVNALVAVLHTAPFAECLERKEPADPFDAYEGSAALGRLLARRAKLRLTWCICGHRHRPLDLLVEGVRVVRCPVGYLDGAVEDLGQVAGRSIGVIELP